MKRCAIGIILVLGLGSPALANEEPITVNADEMQQVQDENVVKFTGDVEVILGTMTLRSDEGHAFYGEGGPSDLVEYFAFGDRVFLVSPDQDVEADEARYDFAASTLRFAGTVIVVSAGSRIESDVMTVHIDEGRTSFGSPETGQRISFTTSPPAAEE